MIIEKEVNNVTATGLGRVEHFKNNAEDLAKQFRILRNNIYSDKILACIREYSNNAKDSHIDSLIDRPIKVTFPTNLEPYFKVRDYGNGLCEDDIYNVYTMYFKSTKEKSNATNGCLGLGSKAGFCYGDSFSVISYHTGIESHYECYIDDTELGSSTCLSKKETAEQGVEIIIPVNPKDINSFKLKGREFFQYWDILPESNMELHKYNWEQNSDYHGEIDGCNWYLKPSTNGSGIFMSDILYPLESHFWGQFEQECADFINFNRLIIKVPSGVLSFAVSREALEYNKKNIKTLKYLIKKIIKSVRSQFSLKLDGTLYEQAIALNGMKETMNSMVSILKPAIASKKIDYTDKLFSIPLENCYYITKLKDNKIKKAVVTSYTPSKALTFYYSILEEIPIRKNNAYYRSVPENTFFTFQFKTLEEATEKLKMYLDMGFQLINLNTFTPVFKTTINSAYDLTATYDYNYNVPYRSDRVSNSWEYIVDDVDPNDEVVYVPIKNYVPKSKYLPDRYYESHLKFKVILESFKSINNYVPRIIGVKSKSVIEKHWKKFDDFVTDFLKSQRNEILAYYRDKSEYVNKDLELYNTFKDNLDDFKDNTFKEYILSCASVDKKSKVMETLLTRMSYNDIFNALNIKNITTNEDLRLKVMNKYPLLDNYYKNLGYYTVKTTQKEKDHIYSYMILFDTNDE